MNSFKPIQFAVSLIALSLIFIFNTIGLYNEGFIYKYYWVSEIEHFLGGLFGGMLFASIYAKRGLVLFCVFIMGVTWEMFEYFVANYIPVYIFITQILRIKDFEFFWWDTGLDLIIDVLGAYIYLTFINKKEA